jgi:LysR family nitrogen assimilation transcriptional regulator
MTGLMAGLGCTLAPQVFVSDSLASGALHARRIIDPVLTRRLYIGHRKDRPATRLAEALTRLLLSLIADEVRKGAWHARPA